MTIHHLDDTQPHAFWDNSHPARLSIRVGDTIVLETLEASDGQVRPDFTSEVLGSLAPSLSRAQNPALPSRSRLSAFSIRDRAGTE